MDEKNMERLCRKKRKSEIGKKRLKSRHLYSNLAYIFTFFKYIFIWKHFLKWVFVWKHPCYWWHTFHASSPYCREIFYGIKIQYAFMHLCKHDGRKLILLIVAILVSMEIDFSLNCLKLGALASPHCQQFHGQWLYGVIFQYSCMESYLYLCLCLCLYLYGIIFVFAWNHICAHIYQFIARRNHM